MTLCHACHALGCADCAAAAACYSLRYIGLVGLSQYYSYKEAVKANKGKQPAGADPEVAAGEWRDTIHYHPSVHADMHIHILVYDICM